MLEGPRFPDVERPGGGTRSPSADTGIPGEIAAFKRASAATERTFRAGIEAVGRLSGPESYFLAIDPFDPVDATEAPPIYVKPGEVEDEGIGPMDGRLRGAAVERTPTSTRCARPTAATWSWWTSGWAA